MRWYTDDEALDFGKIGRGTGGDGIRESKLMLSKETRRGGGIRISVPKGSPLCVVRFGYTERRGVGADARQTQRNTLRRQANYLDRQNARDIGFDARGEVGQTWERVRDWADDRRYFRASINPEEGNRIPDWPSFIREYVHELSGTILTPEERRAGIEVDWSAVVHKNTGRDHAHVLMRGRLGDEDLWLHPDIITSLHEQGSLVAGRQHHLGLNQERAPEIERAMEKEIRREINLEERDMHRTTQRELEME